jgi:hypothetical protein
MRMTTSNSEITTPTSYVSRWIAQSHNAYQKKINEFYSPSSPTSSSSSSCDFRTASNKTPPLHITSTKTTTSKPHITTWQAQAKSRLDAMTPRTDDNLFPSTSNITNNELQEKLHRVR